jgi:2-polyprenyl-6-hydroxyphenyl methylase/3-demethylubiquinone-9 3-methyltransferase
MKPARADDAVDYFSENSREFGDLYRTAPDFHERLGIWHDVLDRHARKGGVAYDMGCGTGVFSFYLAEKGGSVVGLDGAADMVALCEARRKERGLNNVRFVQARLPEVDETALPEADLVISSSVVEYVDDLDAILALFGRRLGPRGTLIVSMPNASSLSRWHQRIKYRLTGKPDIYRYIKHFTVPRALGKKLSRHGFVLCEVHYYGHARRLAQLGRAIGLPRPLTEDLFLAVFSRDDRARCGGSRD